MIRLEANSGLVVFFGTHSQVRQWAPSLNLRDDHTRAWRTPRCVSNPPLLFCPTRTLHGKQALLRRLPAVTLCDIRTSTACRNHSCAAPQQLSAAIVAQVPLCAAIYSCTLRRRVFVAQLRAERPQRAAAESDRTRRFALARVMSHQIYCPSVAQPCALARVRCVDARVILLWRAQCTARALRSASHRIASHRIASHRIASHDCWTYWVGRSTRTY